MSALWNTGDVYDNTILGPHTKLKKDSMPLKQT